ncbi:DUF3099 domain-containing protein [Ornithinimicrobium faecis]|uniref:DUF3099 domain-containing protein n=1 Tax=Ornithinimicrobium faecis TaxID=2934158 RepID=A0ABY4YQ29_9MICO|nr:MULTISPECIES: DUF3099 domain-containing protein [unclassified Ornithinimicrobium]USQ78252.1 DUF3099 domain-containing protein [Ornithinimicrobium sp. HY1793]
MRRKKVAQGVTTVRRSPKEDREQRMRSYAIAMSIRTVSFPLAVWALLSGWTVIGIVLALAATFLPQVAVMTANAVDHRTAPAGHLTSPTRMLGPGDSTTSRETTTPRDGPDAEL